MVVVIIFVVVVSFKMKATCYQLTILYFMPMLDKILRKLARSALVSARAIKFAQTCGTGKSSQSIILCIGFLFKFLLPQASVLIEFSMYVSKEHQHV